MNGEDKPLRNDRLHIVGYADGRDELLVCLSAHFGTPFEFGLYDSTSFKSRVMWPESLRDEPLFEYLEPPPRNRFTAWLRRMGVKPSSNIQVLAPNVQTLVSGTDECSLHA